jgi:Cu(I)/Ag(I) efflux system protein CusF
MTAIPYRPLVFASVILLALPACAATIPTSTVTEAPPPVAIDLGPSSRVPQTRMAMAGTGHEARRTGMSNAPSSKAQLVHEGGGDAHAAGTVNAVDPAQHKINLSHGAISALGWPAMTMEFPVAPSVDLTRIRPGSRVDFTLEKKGAGGMYEIQSVQPAGGGR